jgi:hypothetical protein
MCGLISQYNAEESPCGPGNLFNVITKRLTMQGFIVSDHMDEYPAFLSDMAEWIQAGEIRWKYLLLQTFSARSDSGGAFWFNSHISFLRFPRSGVKFATTSSVEAENVSCNGRPNLIHKTAFGLAKSSIPFGGRFGWALWRGGLMDRFGAKHRRRNFSLNRSSGIGADEVHK